MISKLNILEFKGRLKYHTKKGDPTLKGTPFALFTIFTKMNKKFYGGYNDSQFELTLNATLFPIPYIISGTFRSKTNSETKLSYEIKRIWFGYLWVRIVPVLFIILFNYLVITTSHVLRIELLIIGNLILLISFTPLLIIRMRRKKMIKDFENIFEVEK